MNQHRTKMMKRKKHAGRGEFVKPPSYLKPEPGYDLSKTKQKEMT